MEPVYERILSNLYDHPEVTFRELQELTAISPKTLKKRLAELKNRKLISENGRKNWKQGKSLSYLLTEKGKNEYLKQAINTMKESIENYFRVLPLLDEQALLLYREDKRNLYPITTVSGKYGGEITLQPDNFYRRQKLKEAFEKYRVALEVFKDAYFTFWGEWETFSN